MTFATAFMRKVLESDLSDTKALPTSSRHALRRVRERVQFHKHGAVNANLTYAQDDVQLDDTTELYSEHRVKQASRPRRKRNITRPRCHIDLRRRPHLQSRLFSFALTAAGIDPTVASGARSATC